MPAASGIPVSLSDQRHKNAQSNGSLEDDDKQALIDTLFEN